MSTKASQAMSNVSPGLALLSKRGLAALAAGTAQLPFVHDYYCGWYCGGQWGADNVLLFSRTAESLDKLNKVRRDFHHRFVLAMSLRGAGEVEVDGKPIVFRPGDALLLPPFALHRYLAIKTSDPSWLFVTFDHTAPRPEHLTVSRYPITAEAGTLLSAMIEWRMAAGDRPPHAIARRSTALAATLLLERLAAAPGGSVVDSDATPGDAELWLAPVLRRVGDMSELPPTLDELAEVAHLSASSLRSQFLKRFGISLGRYSRQLRVRHALSMVVSGNLTIGEAAARCGFSSVYVFSRSAKTVLGCSPTDYIDRARRGVN